MDLTHARCTVLYFASSREHTGMDQESLSMPTRLDAATVIRLLGERHPAAVSILNRSRVAVNHAFIDAPFELHDGDEIAVIPPVSGG